jgi:hypothetical protein
VVAASVGTPTRRSVPEPAPTSSTTTTLAATATTVVLPRPRAVTTVPASAIARPAEGLPPVARQAAVEVPARAERLPRVEAERPAA